MAIGFMVSAFIEILFTGSSCATNVMDYKAHVTPILMGLIILGTFIRYTCSEGLGTYGNIDLGVWVGFIVWITVGGLFVFYPLLMAVVFVCKYRREV
jgi:hypothetical protein